MTELTKLIRGHFTLAAIGSLLAVSHAGAALRPLAPIPLVTAAEDLYGGRIRIAPDNSKVFFVAQEAEPFYATTQRLYEVPIAGGPITTRTTESNGIVESVLGYDFAPDGMGLVILEGDINCLGCTIGDAFVMPIAAGSPQQITFDNGISGNPFWRPQFSQDESRMLYLGVNPDRQFGLLSVPLDGSAPATRLNNPLHYYFSDVRSDWKYLPNSNEVLYVAHQASDNGYNLFKVNASGGTSQRVNLTDNIHLWTGVRNSFATDASGNRAAYGVRQGPAGRPTVFSRGLSGGPEVELTPALAKHDDVEIDMYGFAQDQLIFEADFNNAYRYDLYTAAFDGGPARNITAPYSYLADSAFISPNGDAVIFTTYANAVWPPYPDTKREVLLYEVASGSIRSLGVYPPSSNLPYFQFNAAGDQFVMQGSGVPSKLFTAEGDFVRSFDDGFAQFHPDGEHFLRFGSLPGTPPYHPELFLERLDGEGDPVHISNDKFGISGVREFAFSIDGMTLIYARSDFGQPIEIFAVSLVPEPGTSVVAFMAVAWLSGIRRIRPRLSNGAYAG